jgi:hypothetical protein
MFMWPKMPRLSLASTEPWSVTSWVAEVERVLTKFVKAVWASGKMFRVEVGKAVVSVLPWTLAADQGVSMFPSSTPPSYEG